MAERSFLIGACVFVVAIGVPIAVEVRLQRRLDAAEDQVVTWKNRLSADRDEQGRWKKWPSSLIPETDPWGNPLRVRYESGRNRVSLTVSSDGPDKKQWSADDIKDSATDVDWMAAASDGAQAVQEVAGATTRGLVGGVIEGVTDHIPKKIRDELGIPSERDKNTKSEKK